MREPGHANQLGESAYLLDQNYLTTQRVEWGALMVILKQFERTTLRFFRLFVTNHLHHGMVQKAT